MTVSMGASILLVAGPWPRPRATADSSPVEANSPLSTAGLSDEAPTAEELSGRFVGTGAVPRFSAGGIRTGASGSARGRALLREYESQTSRVDFQGR